MKKLLFLLIILPILNSTIGFSQSRYIDSLINYNKTAVEDTHKLSVLTIIIESISDDDIWSKYNDELGPVAKKLSLSTNPAIRKKAKSHYSDYLNNKGYLLNNLGDITQALEYFHESLKIQAEIDDKKGQSYSLNNIGFIYNNQKQYDRALSYYKKSIALQIEIDDKHGEALSLNNIGNIYDKNGGLKKSLFYYFKSLNIAYVV